MRHDPEEVVLAAVLLDEEKVTRIINLLSPEQFRDERNRLIFVAMYSIYAEKIEVNLVTIKVALSQMYHNGGVALEFVGESYVNLIAVGVPPFNDAFESALLDLAARPKRGVVATTIKEDEWPDTIG